MEAILISLLLLDITKRDLKLLVVLYLLYIKSMENKGKTIKIRDIATLTGLTSTAVVGSLDDLINYNVVGRLILESGLNRKIKHNFDNKFLQTLNSINKKDKTHEAINRVGYYITDDTSIYVFNPIMSSWRYLKWKNVEKALKLLENITDDKLVELLLKNKNTNRNRQDQSVQGISIKACLTAFCDKFKSTHGTVYSINYKVEYTLMKALLKQITANKLLSIKEYLKFLDWAFLQSKEKTKVLHIANLKFYANEYVTKIQPNKEFYYNDDGVLIKRKCH